MKKWFKRRIKSSINWFVTTRFFKRPRLWDNKEWKTISSKEQIWVWYKHHLYLKGLGSAEVNQVTDPLKDIMLYGSVAFLMVGQFYEMIGIPVNATQLLSTVAIAGILLWGGNTILQWVIGNLLDNFDFPAWEAEIGNRRNNVFREIRKAAEKEEWRQQKG